MFNEKTILDFKHNNKHYDEICETCKEFPGMSVAFAPSMTTYFNEIELVKTNKFTFENTLGEFFYLAVKNKRK